MSHQLGLQTSSTDVLKKRENLGTEMEGDAMWNLQLCYHKPGDCQKPGSTIDAAIGSGEVVVSADTLFLDF